MARSLRRREMLAAFRKYARLGLGKNRLATHLIYARLRGVSRTEAGARELLAVYDTVRLLRLQRSPALAAAEALLLDPHATYRHRTDMTYAVRRYAQAHHYDERTVYRQLALVEDLYLRLLAAAEEDGDA